MRVLTDQHHADLLYSLQLLFEDRLGFDLFVAKGHEWWDEGYWRFGEVWGDDRLAQQFLGLNDTYLDHPNLTVSLLQRQRAIDLFGIETISRQWAAYLS